MANVVPRPGTTYVPRRPRNLQVMTASGEPTGEEVETEEEYNALFGITEENPQGVGIDEFGPGGGGVRQDALLAGTSESESSGGGYGKKREGQQSRGEMDLTKGKKSSILTSPY